MHPKCVGLRRVAGPAPHLLDVKVMEANKATPAQPLEPSPLLIG